MDIDNPEYQKKLWMEAIALRIDEMVSGHPEIDSDSRALLVDAVIAGLHAHPGMLKKWQEGNSFIEHSFFDDEDQDNTKLSSSKRAVTRISKKLSNGVKYSISGPFFNSKRGKKNG